MEEKLIDFDTAKLAKEKGCEIELFTDDYEYENEYGETVVCNYDPTNRLDEEKFNVRRIVLCTQSLLQKWLREEHSIHVEVLLSDNSPYNTFYYRVMEVGKYFTLSHDGVYVNTYEEALEKGLLEALKLINK